MNAERETVRIVRSWLEEGRTALPDHVLDAVLDQLPSTPQRRAMWPARRARRMSTFAKFGLAAAAVLALAFAAFGGRPTPAPTPAPTPTPGPSDRLVETEGPLAPGAWAFDVESVRVVFDLPATGWQKNAVPNAIWTGGSMGRITFDVVENLFADPCSPTLLRDPPVGPTVDALASALSSLPGVDAGQPIDTSLGGFNGKLVEIVLAASDRPCADLQASLWPLDTGEPVPLESGSRVRHWILDVEGTRLVVSAVERDGLPQVMRNELQAIVDSIVIRPS